MMTMMPLDLSTLQLLALPVLAFIAWRISILGLRIPRLAVLAGLACALMALWWTSTYRRDSSGTFLLARFENDPYEIESSLLRRELNSMIKTSEGSSRYLTTPRLEMYPGEIARPAEVRRRFAADSSLRFFADLKGHWLRFHFPDDDARGLEMGRESAGSIGLRPVRSIATSGMSLEPGPESLKVILAMMRAQTLPPAVALNDAQLDERALDLMEGILANAFWTSIEHRAWLLWQLGNLHLEEALRDGNYQKAEIVCALESYRQAVSYLRRTRVHELLAAVRNNMAVAHYQQFLFDGRPRVLRRALAALKRAEGSVAVMRGERYHTAEIVRQNIQDFLSSHRPEELPEAGENILLEEDEDAD